MTLPVRVTRRGFVLGSVAGSAALALPLTAARASSRTPSLLLYDDSMDDGRRFAAWAKASGRSVHDTGRDLAQLLYGEQRDWARSAGSTLAGVTRYADYQVASGIARENGRSVAAALTREQDGGALRVLAGTPAYLASLAHEFGLQGTDLAALDRLITEPGTIAWLCA